MLAFIGVLAICALVFVGYLYLKHRAKLRELAGSAYKKLGDGGE